MWDRRGITTETKLKVYKEVVLTTLQYGCDSWTVYQRYARKLNHFHITTLRKLLDIKWQDKIPETEVLTRAKLPSIYTILMQTQLRWAGHKFCMPDHPLPKKLLFRELEHAKCSHGGQKKCFKDTLKVSLKAFGISHNLWEQAAMDRPKKQASVCSGEKSHKANRIAAAEQHRQDRKSRANSLAAATISYSHCTRTFRVWIGLTSHLRTHRDRLPSPRMIRWSSWN